MFACLLEKWLAPVIKLMEINCHPVDYSINWLIVAALIVSGADGPCISIPETGNDGQYGDAGHRRGLGPPGPALPLQHEHPALRRLPQTRRHGAVPEVQSPAGEQT